MHKIIMIVGLSGALLLASCRPTGGLIPSPGPTVSPLPTSVAPQGLPTVPPSPIGTAAVPASGFHLTATTGPTCPGPEKPGQVCTKPFEGMFVVTNDSGAEVTSITTDQDGKAAVDLPPGVYTVTAKIEGRFPVGTPTTVTVLPGQYAEVSVELDTGIR